MAGAHLPFKTAVESRDWDAVPGLLAEDVTFWSPAVHRPYVGREATAMVLAAVAQVFEDFTYVDVLDDGDRVALVFRTRVGDREVQGLDLLAFDDAGRIAEFTVMLRPLSGLQAVLERMSALLAGR